MARNINKIVLAVGGGVLGFVLLVAAGIGVALWRDHRGETRPESERAEAQAVVDRCSPDYPIKVKRVSRHEFIGKSWFEVELQAVEDPKITFTAQEASLSSFGSGRCLKFERTQMKIQRDGSVGTYPGGHKLPEDLAKEFYYTSYADSSDHPQPEPDFSTRDPYPYPTHVTLTVDRRTQNLGTDDATLIRRVVDATNAQGVELDVLRYHLSGPTGNEQADWFDLDAAALASPTLQEDLANAKAGRTVDGITYHRYRG